MSNTAHIASRLQDLVGQYNREVWGDVLIKAGLGVVFSLVVFGLLYWFSWFVGVLIYPATGLVGWQFGTIFTGIFLAVAVASAWWCVNPLAGLEPLSDPENLIAQLSRSAGVMYFSPRHAIAGAALFLIGGPANVFEAIGIWRSRMRANGTLILEAAHLLAACKDNCPIEEVRGPAAAVLLRRLGLIKAVPAVDSWELMLTDKGLDTLGPGKKGKRKRSRRA
jgi:hypothetical protein